MDAKTFEDNLNRAATGVQLQMEQARHAAKFVDAGIATSEAVERMHAEMVSSSRVATETLIWARIAGIGTLVGVVVAALALWVSLK